MRIDRINMEISDQELLTRAEVVALKTRGYQTYVYALEIYKSDSKAFLAEIKIAIRAAVEKISETELESRALASKKWQDKNRKYQEYLMKAGRAKMELEEAVVRYEAMRSALSSRKAEVKSFGG